MIIEKEKKSGWIQIPFKYTNMEANPAQQIAGMVHEPLFWVFIDVRKAYNSLDIGRCIDIIRGYGLGINLHRLLQQYWDGGRCGTEGPEIIWTTVPERERGDTGGPGLTNYLQHCGGRSGNGGPTGSLQNALCQYDVAR